MTSYEVQVLFRVEWCEIMIPDAKFQTLWLLESLRVQYRYVMAPKINEMIHLVSLIMTVLSVSQSVSRRQISLFWLMNDNIMRSSSVNLIYESVHDTGLRYLLGGVQSG